MGQGPDRKRARSHFRLLGVPNTQNRKTCPGPVSGLENPHVRMTRMVTCLKSRSTQRVSCPVLMSPCTQKKSTRPARFSLIQH